MKGLRGDGRAQAVTELLKLTPAAAMLVTLDALGRVVTEEEVPAALVQRGDHLKVRALASGVLLVWACTAILERASSPCQLGLFVGWPGLPSSVVVQARSLSGHDCPLMICSNTLGLGLIL